MIVWLLLISMNFNQAVAFRTHEACAEAASHIKVPVVCVAFAADISDGKTL